MIHALSIQGDAATMIHLIIPAMVGTHCVSTIANAIRLIDPTARVEADPSTRLLKVDTLALKIEVQWAIANAGYRVEECSIHS